MEKSNSRTTDQLLSPLRNHPQTERETVQVHNQPENCPFDASHLSCLKSDAKEQKKEADTEKIPVIKDPLQGDLTQSLQEEQKKLTFEINSDRTTDFTNANFEPNDNLNQHATNSFQAILNIKDSLERFTYSPNPNPVQAKDFRIPQQHIDHIHNFVMSSSNMDLKQMMDTLFGNNQDKKLYTSGADPTEFKSDGSDNENENK